MKVGAFTDALWEELPVPGRVHPLIAGNRGLVIVHIVNGFAKLGAGNMALR